MLLHRNHPRTIFRLAMACLALFGVLGIVHPPSTFNENIIDAIRGVLLGGTIALVFLYFRTRPNRGS